MNRKMAMFMPEGWLELGRTLPPSTVLDGECVYDDAVGTSVYLVFDLLAINGQCVMGMLFKDRLGLLQTSVAPRCLPLLSRFTTGAIQSMVSRK